jgi:hypothetical protein
MYRGVYHSTDNFLAAVALRKAISITEPEIGTLQHFLSKYIYVPLNLSSVMQRSKTTYDPVKNGFLQESILDNSLPWMILQKLLNLSTNMKER